MASPPDKFLNNLKTEMESCPLVIGGEVFLRIKHGGISHTAWVVEADLVDRETGLRKQHIEGLSDLVACALGSRSANTAEWQAILPRRMGEEKSKERYVSRFLGNRLICPLAVMAGFIPELAVMAGRGGKTLVLPMDQSRIANGLECLMVSLRVGERAIPVAWTVKATSGPIGFEEQKALLEQVFALIPADIAVMLAADRFYGTAALIDWCQRHGWDYRLRLKGNLVLRHEGGEITTGEAARQGIATLIQAQLNQTPVHTNIGIVHDKGNAEPWIIAMSQAPSRGRVLDYGMRWGIEPMFSDFKSRGFGITQTHLKNPDRIERMILILTIALFWAVSTGMRPKNTRFTQKSPEKPDFLLQNRHSHTAQCCSHPRPCSSSLAIRKTCRVVRPMADRLAPDHYDRLHHFISDGIWDAGPLEAELAV